METFKSLRDQVTQWLDEESITATESRVNEALNQAHQLRLAGRRWPFLRWPTYVSITLTSEDIYPLQAQVGLLDAIWNQTVDTPLVETAAADLHKEDVQDSYHFLWTSTSPVKCGSSLDERPKLKSSSVSDTAVTLAIAGVDSAGEAISETLTATGTSAVTATNTYAQILHVTKSTGWVGTATLYKNDGTTVLVSLGASEYQKEYPRIQLLGTPTVGDEIRYTFYRKPRVLSADTDIPDIPWPYSQVLVWDALLLLAAYNEGIAASSIARWRELQSDWSHKLELAYLHGRTANAQAYRLRDGDTSGL